MNKTYIGWIACQQAFYQWTSFGYFQHFPLKGQKIDHNDAIEHWVNGTALFGENAQRIVSNLNAQQGGF